MQRIGVIFGGKSGENEVSLATGRYVYSLLDKEKFLGVPLYMDAQGEIWEIHEKLILSNSTRDVYSRLEKNAKKIRFEDLKEKIDLMFIALLGKYGEDGCIQGVLELLKIPYTGSGVLASALCMDKKYQRILLEAKGFKVAKGIVINKNQFNNVETYHGTSLQIKNNLGLPCVVKPTREGSSLGVSVVKKEEHLQGAIEKAFEYDTDVLIEEYLKGLEYTCVVYGNENPVALTPTEVAFTGDFFDYESKYMPGKTQTITPARVSPEILEKIKKNAEEVYKLFHIKGYGRVDGFVVKDEVYITEPHTGSIMVPSSFIFQQASQYRIELEDKFTGKKVKTPLSPGKLVTKIIEQAELAHKGKKGSL